MSSIWYFTHTRIHIESTFPLSFFLPVSFSLYSFKSQKLLLGGVADSLIKHISFIPPTFLFFYFLSQPALSSSFISPPSRRYTYYFLWPPFRQHGHSKTIHFTSVNQKQTNNDNRRNSFPSQSFYVFQKGAQNR